MPYKHGIYVTEAETSLTPAVEVDTPPVFIVTAPVHLASEAKVNTPVLCYTKAEAEAAFGYGESDDIWDNFTAPQVIKAAFELYGVKPVILINVLDPATHKEEKTQTVTVVEGTAEYKLTGFVLAESVTANQDLVKGTDFAVAYNDDGEAVVTLVSATAKAKETIVFTFNVLKPAAVTDNNVIGGETADGTKTGMYAVHDVYPKYRVVPGIIAAPGFTRTPAVAAALETVTELISGLFRAVVVNDLPTENNGAKIAYSEIAAYKTTNGYTGARMINCWPRLVYGGKKYFYSAQFGCAAARADYENDGVPSESPSNKTIYATGIIYSDGTEITLNYDQAAAINGQGIVTAINGPNGWTVWGNRTGAYPATADVKDAFIPIKRMFCYAANTLIVNNWAKLDGKLVQRRIESMVNDTNVWLNGLASREHILGGRLEFRQEDNSTADLMDGKVVFRLYITPPSPIRDIEFVLEYDTSYVATLFG